jgi:desulfoferrodoxin-like iron-binding protein
MNTEGNDISRRDFLNAAAVGAAVIATGPIFKIAASDQTAKKVPDIYVCGICGHVEFGAAPEKCPVCHAPREKFSESNTIFSDAQKKFPTAGVSHDPVISIKKDPSLVSEIPCKEISVRVGKTMHPMEEAHHIAFIDFYIDDKFIDRIGLNLQVLPAVSFYTKATGSKIRMLEYCTVHGYWQTEISMV